MRTLLLRLALFCALLLLLAASARATTITISAAAISNVQAGTGTYDLRIWLDRNMVDSLGVLYAASAADSPNVFKKVSCALSTTTVTCDSFTLPSTIDAQEGNTAKYTAKLYRNNSPLLLYNKPFALPASLGASVTWEQIWRFNNAVPIRVPDSEFYTKSQVNALYAGGVFSTPATTTTRGVGKVSVSAADPTFVDVTDPVFDATYITQTPDSNLSAEQALSLLGTGILKSTTGTGVVSIAGASDMPSGIDAAKIGAGAVSNTEFAYLDGVTSGVQAQLDAKAPPSATYITQTANATLTNEQALGALATGILKSTTTTGVLSIAAANTDFLAPSQTYYTLSSTSPSGQTFTQLDQPTGTPYPAYAGLLYTATPAAQGNEFAAVFRIRLTNQLKASLPSGHLQGYGVGLYGEARTTAGTATDYNIDGGNFVAESNTLHTGDTFGLEVNINQGSLAVQTTTFVSPATNTRFSAGVNITSGGTYQPNAGLYIDAVASNNKYVRGAVFSYDCCSNRMIEGGRPTDPVPASLSGIVLFDGVDTGNIYVVRQPSSVSGGAAFLLRNYANTANLFAVDYNGVANLTGTASVPQLNLSSATTNTGLSIARTGGGATLNVNTDGFASGVPSIYTAGANDLAFGSNSTERLRVTSGGNVTIGTAALATTATDGFLYIPSSAGLPTGVPTSYTGRVPVLIDTTNAKICAYFGGAWHCTAAF